VYLLPFGIITQLIGFLGALKQHMKLSIVYMMLDIGWLIALVVFPLAYRPHWYEEIFGDDMMVQYIPLAWYIWLMIVALFIRDLRLIKRDSGEGRSDNNI